MTASRRNESRRCLVDGRPLPPTDRGRPRLYCSSECKRRADGAAREIDHLRGLIPQWRGISSTRVAGLQAEIRALERILAARRELVPRSESVAATVRALRALAARIAASDCEHAADLEALLAGFGRRPGA